MRTSAEESFKDSQSSRQAETTSTRPTVIDVTRPRRHRQDHDGGDRHRGKGRRQAIGKLGPVDLVRRSTHPTGNVLTEDNRPAIIRQNQPVRLHLTAKRRTTFNVQPMLIGSVDHKRLRIDEHRFPLWKFRKFHQNTSIPHFFLPCLWWFRNRGIKRHRSSHLPFRSGRINPE